MVALTAPSKFLRIVGLDPEHDKAATYFLRMFGIRTIFLGLQLLIGEGEDRDQAVRRAVYIHAADTGAAVFAGATGALPARTAISGALTSSVNTVLSLIARGGEPA